MRLWLTHGASALAVALVLGGAAMAADTPPPATDPGRALNSGGALAPTGGAVDTSQGGVGGTGLGTVPPGSIDGKGMSVKGQAGQGIKPAPTAK